MAEASLCARQFRTLCYCTTILYQYYEEELHIRKHNGSLRHASVETPSSVTNHI
jgi:hypothetical protein